MAVPPEFTILNISGTFTMNKTLSDFDKADTILSLQGVGWFKRQAIRRATVTLMIKHYKDDAGVEHIDIDQTLTGGIPGTREERQLDGQMRNKDDSLFGPVCANSSRLKPNDIEEDYLKNGWTTDTLEHGLVFAYAESDTPKSHTSWIGKQTWGIEEFNGERRYTRRVKFLGPKGEDIEAHLIYDMVVV
ncbi:hypothetical protein C8J56DRAFT_918572 [Mycena floridula]|nr:hypothetical protein C8J56DRAFT_918572 [Mycena floridula]